MDSNTERRIDLGFALKDKIAARLERQGMRKAEADSVACRDLIKARHSGLAEVHGVNIADLSR